MDLMIPSQVFCKSLLRQCQASQLGLDFGKEEKVLRSEIWRIGWFGDQLHALRQQELHPRGSSVDRGIIPMQEILLQQNYGPLQLETFSNLARAVWMEALTDLRFGTKFV
jgi:hypothetical protein